MHGSPTSARNTNGHTIPLDDENIRNDQTIGKSPRTAMSRNSASVQYQLPIEPLSASTMESQPVEANGTIERRRNGHPRSARERRRRTGSHQVDLSLMSLSRLDLDRMRSDSRPESVQMRDLLETALRQVHLESKRAAELQRTNEETAARFRVLNENRLAAQQEAIRANTELKLFQFQLDSAQNEIEKARTALQEVEKQRDEAETAAARAREKARKYQQERLVANAREEGRQLGFEAGLSHAKEEREMLAARRLRHVPQGRHPAPTSTRKTKGKERVHYPEDRRRRPRHPTPHDMQSSPDDSPRLPVRNLPDMRAGTSRRIPTRVSRRRQETEEEDEGEEEEEEEEGAQTEGQGGNETESEREQPSQSQPTEVPRAKTPSVYNWKVDVPAAGKVDESFNSTEHPNDAVRQGPRNQWVTAFRHQEIRGASHVQGPSKAAQTPKSQLLSPTRPSDSEQVVQSAQSPPVASSSSAPAPAPIIILPQRQEPGPAFKPAPAIKSVKFWARRPSLAKTKQQATSWYRSLSFRKKSKPVIDPIAEEPTDTPPSTSAALGETSDYPPPPPGALYGPRPQTSQSWYQKGASAAPSVRSNNDYAFARRQPSDLASVSTRVSQFDLLATPAQNMNANVLMGTGGAVNGATRSKGKAPVREKESLLSIIREDTASRGNTPERPHGYGAAGSESMHRDFGQRSGVQQRPSYGTFNGSVQNMQRSQRPPSLNAPDPEPAGDAYQNHIAPDTGRPPPHAGRNHPSPYHVFQAGESSRGAVDRIYDPAKASPRPNSAAYGRPASGGAPDSPPQAPRPPFASTWAAPGQNPSASGGAGSRPVSRASRRQLLRPAISTGTFKVVNPDPSSPSSTTSPGGPSEVAHGRAAGRTVHPGQMAFADAVAPANAAGHAAFVLTPRHQPSRASMKSSKSYSKYNPDEYVDPAFWGVDGPGGPPAATPAQPRPGMMMMVDEFGRSASRLSKRASVNSGLSYA